jgi:cobalamin biosynthesis protein CobT
MKRLNGIQLRSGVEKAVHKIASTLGYTVTLSWVNGLSTACVNSSFHIRLANVADDAVVTEAVLHKYVGFVLHELLHVKYTNFLVNGKGHYVRMLHNAIEDAWIENTAIATRLTGNAEGLLTALVDGMVDEAMVAIKDWSDPCQYPFVLAVFCRTHGKDAPVAEGLGAVFTEAAARTLRCTNSTDTLEVAEWVYAQLQTLGDKPKADQDQGKGQGQADGQGQDAGDGQGQGDGQADGQGQGAGDGPQSDSEGSNGDDQGQGKGKVATEDKSAGKAQRVTNENHPARKVEPSIDGSSGYGGSYSSGVVVDAGDHTSHRTFDLSITANARLRYEVRRLFENTANDEWQINRRAGSLNVRALPNVYTSETLFKRRLENEGVDSAVVIMLDVSGSMYDTRYFRDADGNLIRDAQDKPKTFTYMEYAVKVCAALMDTLHRAGVKIAIHTFASDVAVFKPFDMPMQRALERLSHVGGETSTNDYTALRFTHEGLYKRPEARKAVFVITDGVGDGDATLGQVKAGEALGMTTVGIGICHDVSKVYPKSIRINALADLADASFKQIKLAA